MPEENETCECGSYDESHTCPYKEEMGGTNKYEECNCCSECTQQCEEDV